jgi:hypothetical protein
MKKNRQKTHESKRVERSKQERKEIQGSEPQSWEEWLLVRQLPSSESILTDHVLSLQNSAAEDN